MLLMCDQIVVVIQLDHSVSNNGAWRMHASRECAMYRMSVLVLLRSSFLRRVASGRRFFQCDGFKMAFPKQRVNREEDKTGETSPILYQVK
jgi:hypothetical protein